MLPGENFRFSYISQEHHIFWPLMQDEFYEGLQHTFYGEMWKMISDFGKLSQKEVGMQYQIVARDELFQSNLGS